MPAKGSGSRGRVFWVRIHSGGKAPADSLRTAPAVEPLPDSGVVVAVRAGKRVPPVASMAKQSNRSACAVSRANPASCLRYREARTNRAKGSAAFVPTSHLSQIRVRRQPNHVRLRVAAVQSQRAIALAHVLERLRGDLELRSEWNGTDRGFRDGFFSAEAVHPELVQLDTANRGVGELQRLDDLSCNPHESWH